MRTARAEQGKHVLCHTVRHYRKDYHQELINSGSRELYCDHVRGHVWGEGYETAAWAVVCSCRKWYGVTTQIRH